MRVADRRSRSTFWIDDGIIDRCGPWLGRFPQGTAAIAIYMALARHAGRDAESWPSVTLLAEQTGLGPRTVNAALRLLELAELLVVTEAVDDLTDRQTSNTYTLLTPPAELPEISLDSGEWPAVDRLRVRVFHRDGRRFVSDQRARTDNANACSGGCNICTHRARPIKVKDDIVKDARAPEGESAAVPPTMEGKTPEEWAAALERWDRRYERKGKSR